MNTASAFCTQCGAKMQSVAPAASVGGGAAAAPAPQQQPQPASSGSNFLKIALITVGVIIVLVIGGITVAGFMIKKAVTNAVQVDASGKATSVNLGGLKVETLKDSKLVAEKMGVDVYPGATPQDEGAGSITIGGVTTTNAMFKTTASPDEVFDFYKAKYPDANVSDTPEAKMLMQGTQDKELLTIHVREENGETVIQITHMVKGQ